MATTSVSGAAADLVTLLSVHLPSSAGSVPPHSVVLADVGEAPVGLGQLVGEEVTDLRRVARRAGRLAATVRFDLWGASPADVHTGLHSLQGSLLDASGALRAAGVLRIKPEPASLTTEVASLSAWRLSTQYHVVYEYRFDDPDAADSLIASIPVTSELDIAASPEVEVDTVTDDMARWDDDNAAPLRVRGPLVVTGISVVLFTTAIVPSGNVVVRRTSDDAVVPPDSFLTLTLFLDAIAGPTPASTHAEVVFGTVNGLMTSLTAGPGPARMGDWNFDGVTDEYQPASTVFPQPVFLPTNGDRMEIEYLGPPFDQPAVAYVRLDATPKEMP